ncbi:hypothetical protein BGZ94_003696 [Podila epigama]|nr:hypothetical protein BGZ94_003696 [Podila epigama]
MFSPIGLSSIVNFRDELDSTFDEIKVENDEMKTLLEEASRSPQGTVIIKSPVQTFVDESTKSVTLRLALEYSQMTEDWSEEMLQTHYLGVNYIELHPATIFTSHAQKGPGTVLQSIEVYHKDPKELDPTSRPVPIAVSRINKAGTFAVTLSFTKTQGHLDLWKLQPSLKPDTGTLRQPVAATSFPITRDNYGRPPRLDLSISQDASQIAMFPSIYYERDANGMIPKELQFRVYTYNPMFTPALGGDKKQPLGHHLQLSTKPVDPWLRNFAGAGKFHFLTLEIDGPLKACDERFVACDGQALAVYSTNGIWERYNFLELLLPAEVKKDREMKEDVSQAETVAEGGEEDEEEDEDVRRGKLWTSKQLTATLVDGIHGPYFVWQEQDLSGVTIWDIARMEQISFITFYINQALEGIKSASFSSDGVMMTLVFACTDVTTYMTQSATHIDSTYFELSSATTHFINYDTDLLINVHGRRPLVSYALYPEGYSKRLFLPVTTGGHLHVRAIELIESNTDNPGELERIDVEQENQGEHIATPASKVAEETVQKPVVDVVYLQQGNVISMYSVANSTFPAPKHSPHQDRCTSECRTEAGMLTEKPTECTMPFGLQFTLELGQRKWTIDDAWMPVCLATVNLVTTDSLGMPTRKEILRMIHYDQDCKHQEAYFLPCKTRFLIWGPLYYQVWKLPREATGTCKLIVQQSREFEWIEIYDDIYNHVLEDVVPCRHGNTIRFKDSRNTEMQVAFVPPGDDLCVVLDIDACVNSIRFIIYTYHSASNDYRQMLLRYVNSHVNMRTIKGDDVINCIVSCYDLREQAELFLKHLLARESDNQSLWIRAAKFIDDINPILTVLELAKAFNYSLTLGAILIDYYTQQAKIKCDPGYLTPIMHAMPELVQHQPDLALQAIRRSAFIPVHRNHHSSILKHVKVCPSPSIFSVFKRSIPHVTEIPKPVFQLGNFLPNSATPIESDERDIHFTSSLFVAQFDLLWTYNELLD